MTDCTLYTVPGTADRASHWIILELVSRWRTLAAEGSLSVGLGFKVYKGSVISHYHQAVHGPAKIRRIWLT